MTDRILDLSDSPAYLHISNHLLIVERDGFDKVSIPLPDLAAVVVSHPQVRYSQAVLSELAAAGVAFVTCDRAHLPVGMLIPLAGHSTQVERFHRQAAAPLPLKKRLWQQIIKAKIHAQSRALLQLHGQDHGLAAMAPKVRSGDPQNLEAQASRKYWPALFADSAFRRDREAEDQNRLLNYGYGVLRAIIARALCAAGLHPSLGLHHHNRYNALCLVDDLMEPFRPVVDVSVARFVQIHGSQSPMNTQAKYFMLAALTGRFERDGEKRTLFDLSSRAAQSLASVFMGEARALILPEV